MPADKEEVRLDVTALQEAVRLGTLSGTPCGPEDALKIPYAVLPQGTSIKSLLDLVYPYGLPPEKPHHIKAAVALTDAESFSKYVDLYADSRTRVFADPNALSFRAVLDYHQAPQVQVADGSATDAPTPLAAAQAEFRDHHATLALSKSDQWNLWNGKAEKEIPQAEFAEFIEDNYRDVISPAAATVLEIARDLTAHMDVNFASKVNVKNGTTQFAYQEVLTAGQLGQSGNMEVPEKFIILIPVFFGEKPVTIEARLRFRINGGKLRFIYKLYRPAELLAEAFKVVVKEIEEKLAIEVLLGSI